jgi:hypothetical protein
MSGASVEPALPAGPWLALRTTSFPIGTLLGSAGFAGRCVGLVGIGKREWNGGMFLLSLIWMGGNICNTLRKMRSGKEGLPVMQGEASGW